jgi:hypothetical protein
MKQAEEQKKRESLQQVLTQENSWYLSVTTFVGPHGT